MDSSQRWSQIRCTLGVENQGKDNLNFENKVYNRQDVLILGGLNSRISLHISFTACSKFYSTYYSADRKNIHPEDLKKTALKNFGFLMWCQNMPDAFVSHTTFFPFSLSHFSSLWITCVSSCYPQKNATIFFFSRKTKLPTSGYLNRSPEIPVTLEGKIFCFCGTNISWRIPQIRWYFYATKLFLSSTLWETQNEGNRDNF